MSAEFVTLYGVGIAHRGLSAYRGQQGRSYLFNNPKVDQFDEFGEKVAKPSPVEDRSKQDVHPDDVRWLQQRHNRGGYTIFKTVDDLTSDEKKQIGLHQSQSWQKQKRSRLTNVSYRGV